MISLLLRKKNSDSSGKIRRNCGVQDFTCFLTFIIVLETNSCYVTQVDLIFTLIHKPLLRKVLR